MQKAALITFLLYILWLSVRDARRRAGVSGIVWIVVIWAAMIGSRPVSTWFSFFSSGGQAEAYDEGSPVERLVYFALIALGMFTLYRRQVSMREVMRSNQWLVIFFGYWLCSVVWSDAPFVSFKRWIKDIGNIVMVLVLLTEVEPLEAIKAVFSRCAYVLIPMSVLLIKFYGQLGRTYHVWSGEMMYTGVATHKNTLGVLVLVCGLFFMWDFVDRFLAKHQPRNLLGLLTDLPLVIMAAWLILLAHSATALGCAAVGVGIFFGLAIPVIRNRARNLELYVIGVGFTAWLLDSVLDIKRLIVVDLLGRDLTLTTRTEVWPMLLQHSDGFLLGAGFNSFWSGERLALIYNKLGIIQAHNGYLETYLNGGIVGVILLLALLYMAGKAIKHEVYAGNEFARVRMMFLVIAVIYDLTEAAFDKMGLIWFALLVVLVRYPHGADSVSEATEEEYGDVTGLDVEDPYVTPESTGGYR